MQIGAIDIDRPLLLAPMEDVTDLPFRIICKRLGADIVFTEFVSSEGLVRDNGKTFRKMDFREEERPLGIQIYGGLESSMEGAARIAESLHPDLIDINAGCWVKNVVGCGAGSDLLRDLPRMERIVASVIRSVSLPVTVKTRLGWDAENIRILDVARMLEQAGTAALTVHCRTRAQAHRGVPDFSWIPKVKDAVRMPIIVNGSLTTPAGIRQTFDETGCDGVMIGRGAIDNPWIFGQARQFLATGQEPPPTSLEERFRVLCEHLALAAEHKGERKGVVEFRKHYSGYLKGLSHAARVRLELMAFTEVAPIVERLNRYLEDLQRGVYDRHPVETPVPETT